MLNHAYSDKVFQEACEVIPGGVNSSLRSLVPYLAIRRAEGARLTDFDGNTFLDFHGAFGPPILGHNHAFVRRRVIEALQETLLPGLGITRVEVELARRLCRHIPSAQRVLFCNSGSEATFHALRVARAFTGRSKIIKFEGCYHGVHDYVLVNTSSPAGRLGRLNPGSAGIPRQVLEQTLVCEYNSVDGVESALRAHPQQVAAIIVEPIAHNMGCVLPAPGFLEALRSLTRALGVVLIFDEVITGFRHSLGGYQKICGVTPDLTALGKGMGNGFPIAAVCGRREIMDHFNTQPGGDTFYGGTFNGNTPGCAAALAVIEVMEKEPVHERLNALGDRMRKGLREIHERLKWRACPAGFGSIFLTYFLESPPRNYAEALANDAQLFLLYRQRLIERGVFKVPRNLKRNHISYAHTEDEIDNALQACEDVLKNMARA
jgi:glutamate-1-semialdehyde 2,1-aminomutase